MGGYTNFLAGFLEGLNEITSIECPVHRKCSLNVSFYCCRHSVILKFLIYSMSGEGRGGGGRRRSLISLVIPLLQLSGNWGGWLSITLAFDKHTMYLRSASPHSKQGEAVR